MKSTPIMMKGALVVATLAGIKTNTRRLSGLELVNQEPDGWAVESMGWSAGYYMADFAKMVKGRKEYQPCICQYGGPGDMLWVKETWATTGYNLVTYRADGTTRTVEAPTCEALWKKGGAKWRSAMLMFRWASRLELVLKDVRVQRIQDITAAEALAEGIERPLSPDPETVKELAIWRFRELWNSINEQRGYGWDKNPWVWALVYQVRSAGEA